MVKSPSWEANWFAASQEIPRISRYPKVHYRIHKSPPPVSILGQPYPVHIPTFHLLEIHPNIIRPSTPRSPQWSPSLRFPQQDHRCTNFSNLFLEQNSTCFGQFLCPSSGVFYCTHSNGICHTGLLTACEPVWHTPLLCLQWKTPDDGQRNCPKHVEFYCKINLRN